MRQITVVCIGCGATADYTSNESPYMLALAIKDQWKVLTVENPEYTPGSLGISKYKYDFICPNCWNSPVAKTSAMPKREFHANLRSEFWVHVEEKMCWVPQPGTVEHVPVPGVYIKMGWGEDGYVTEIDLQPYPGLWVHTKGHNSRAGWMVCTHAERKKFVMSEIDRAFDDATKQYGESYW